MKWSSVITAIVIFVGVGALAGGLAFVKRQAIADADANAVHYEPMEATEVLTAREVMWQRTAELVGTAFSLRSVRVSNELAGRVTTVKFESGGAVEAGQVLLALDDSSDQADLAVAQAAIRVAQANLAAVDVRLSLAEVEHERLKNAASVNAVAAMELDRAKSELDASKADRIRLEAEVEQAKARATQVQTRIDKMVIRAPFKARTGMRMVHEGQYLAEGTDIVMLEELTDKIYLDFAIPQDYLSRVRPGVAVMATGEVLGPDPVRIEVVAVDATVNDRTRNVRVRSIVDNQDERLRPGMFVRIRVPVDEPQPHVVVPSTAVRRASHADHVFVVQPDPADPTALRAKHRFVRLGATTGDDVIVLEGLAVGEQIAASGSFKLRDGVKVVKIDPGAAPPAAAADTPEAK